VKLSTTWQNFEKALVDSGYSFRNMRHIPVKINFTGGIISPGSLLNLLDALEKRP
jgi:hypothetical protein